VPLFYGAVWYEYSTQYWVGWPAEENQRWFDTMWSWPTNLPIWFYIAPKGQDPTYPAWIEKLKFPTSKIFEDLAKVIAAPPTPPPPSPGATTVTVERTVTQVQERTLTVVQTQVATVTRTETVTDATLAGVAAIVALIVGVVAGLAVGRRRRPT
jgi:hypothetical protein